MVVGIVGSFHPGVIMAVGTLSARPENRAVGMGLFYSIYYAGGAVAPALCGRAADLWGGAEGALLAAAVLSALAVPMYSAAPAIGGARAHACEGVSDAADEAEQLTRSQQVGAQTSEM